MLPYPILADILASTSLGTSEYIRIYNHLYLANMNVDINKTQNFISVFVLNGYGYISCTKKYIFRSNSKTSYPYNQRFHRIKGKLNQ